MGALDGNGVWIYDETDQPDGTASGLLNLGQDATSTALGLLMDRLDALEAPLNRQCLLTLAKTMTTAAAFVVLGDGTTNGGTYTEVRDPAGMHATSSNTGRITPQTAGKYKITATLDWAANTSDYRGVELRKNGTNLAEQRATPVTSTHTAITLAAFADMNGSSDYFDITQWQNSASTLALSAFVAVEWIGA